jgi:hypothetical protein
MKRGFFLSLILMVILINCVSALTHITNCTDLQNIDNMTETYVLDNNIDCSDTINWNGGTGFEPIGAWDNKFIGTFDGQGYNISNLFINRSVGEQGLIADTKDATIMNINLIDVYVNINTQAIAGGLIGYAENTTLENCSATGTIIGGDYLGLLIAELWSEEPKIINCHSSGSVTSITDNIGYIGGLVGDFENGLILNSYSTANVTGVYATGGLVGHLAHGKVINCFATGKVQGNYYTGGLLGDSAGDFYVNNSYSIGQVNGTTEEGYTGGLIGTIPIGQGDRCSNLYWNTETSEQNISACGTGKTIQEMITQSTYTDWNFVDIWDYSSNCLPTLKGTPFLFCISSPPIIPQGFSDTGQTIYDILNSVGAGLGIFIQILGIPLFILLVIFILVAMIIMVGKSLSEVIQNGIQNKKT